MSNSEIKPTDKIYESEKSPIMLQYFDGRLFAVYMVKKTWKMVVSDDMGESWKPYGEFKEVEE